MKEIIDDNLSVDASKLQVSLAAGKDVGQRLHCSLFVDGIRVDRSLDFQLEKATRRKIINR